MRSMDLERALAKLRSQPVLLWLVCAVGLMPGWFFLFRSIDSAPSISSSLIASFSCASVIATGVVLFNRNN